MRLELHSQLPLSGPGTRTTIFHHVVDLVAAQAGLAPHLLIAPSRGRAPAAAARQTAMYLCHVVAGQTLTEVGRFFGRDRTTVAHACRVVEDLRDDRGVDARLEALEQDILATGSREWA